MDGGERTFKANFSAEGVALLRERVKEKLRELMGNYSDDTLAEYVVVLLRNGRRKDEAAKELQVFLGDDNDTFVSWLWDHLSSNLHLYVQPKAVSTNDEAKIIRSTARGLPVHNSTSSIQNNSEPEAVTQKATIIQQKREWGGLVRDQPEAVPLRSVIATVSNAEEKTLHKSCGVRQTRLPDMHHHRKRIREEGTRQIKRMSHQVIDAPRRLLQFAVRDAVRTGQPMTPKSDSASKRLRSVVSTMASDSALDVRLQKINSGVRIPGATAALRAAAEAAEDVLKDRYSESVFNRLGRRLVLNATEKSFDFTEQDSEREYEDIDTARAENQVEFHERNQYDGSDAYMFDQEADEAADPALDIDGYDDTSAVRYNGLGSYRSTLPSSGGKDSLLVGYGMVQGASAVSSRKSIAQETHASTAPKLSEKILNSSANKNTWKPLNHETARNTVSFEPQAPMEKKVTVSRKSTVTVTCANETPIADNSKDLGRSTSMVEAQKASHAVGSYSTGQPEGGTDSRTVFISNVHFAATKDALSRHFNKFGAVLKTLILTDGVTGQPTGSAYIEFLHKESAEQALTLNGTSFMSRILKVVRRSSLEVPQLPGWSRTSRGSPFASRLIRTAYPRPTFPGSIRGRLPLRGGARSFQWKRDTGDSFDAGKPSQTTPVTPGNQTVTPIARSFTYTRTEPKQDVGATGTI